MSLLFHVVIEHSWYHGWPRALNLLLFMVMSLGTSLVTDKFLISIFVHVILKIDMGFLRPRQIITDVSNLRQGTLSL